MQALPGVALWVASRLFRRLVGRPAIAGRFSRLNAYLTPRTAARTSKDYGPRPRVDNQDDIGECHPAGDPPAEKKRSIWVQGCHFPKLRRRSNDLPSSI